MRPYRVFLMLVAGIGIGWAVRGLTDDGDSKYRQCLAASADLLKSDQRLQASDDALKLANDRLQAASAELRIQADRCLSAIRLVNAHVQNNRLNRFDHLTTGDPTNPRCDASHEGALLPLSAAREVCARDSDGQYAWRNLK